MSLLSNGLLVIYYLALAVIAFYGVHRLLLVALYLRVRRWKSLRPLDPTEWPVVTVQLPLYNEMYVASRIIEAVCRLDYPADRLEIQVLDDSTDETSAIAARVVAENRARGIDIHHLRRTDRRGFKAGALATGLTRARGALLAVFDADFVPQPEFLKTAVPYFTDPGIGMVQGRLMHINRAYSLLTRIQAILIDGRSFIERTACNRSGCFVNLNGNASVWRRKAILEAGGWEHDTLTEDLDLFYRAQLHGWRLLYLPGLAVPAEVPVDIDGFKSQQYRLAKGSIQTARKLLKRILLSKLSLHTKVEIFINLTENISYVLLLVLAILVLPAMLLRQNGSPRTMLLVDLPLSLIASVSVLIFYLASQVAAGFGWRRQVRYLPSVIGVVIGLSVNNSRAVLTALVHRGGVFHRTPKYRIESPDDSWINKRYRAFHDTSAFIEVTLAFYFGICLVYAVTLGMYPATLILIGFCHGYSMIAGQSCMGMILARQRLPLPVGAPVPAGPFATLGLPPLRGTWEAYPERAPNRSYDFEQGPPTRGEALDSSIARPLPRYLQGRFPSRVLLGDEVALQIRIALERGKEARAVALSDVLIPAEGLNIVLALHSPGFEAQKGNRRELFVPCLQNSTWTVFELKAIREGVLSLEVAAYAGGAYLGSLAIETTVDAARSTGESQDLRQALRGRRLEHGEVTLRIRYDEEACIYRFQWIDGSMIPPDEAPSDRLRETPQQAVGELITEINRVARGVGGLDVAHTRAWLRGHGIRLWNQFIPKDLQRKFWEHQGKVKRMLIVSEGDPVPWELLYPFLPGTSNDAGFLAEQFPISRWVAPSAAPPPHLLHLSNAALVGSDDDFLPQARQEIAAIRWILKGCGTKHCEAISELAALTDLLRKGNFSLLHFACHNSFEPVEILLGKQRFQPVLLEEHAGRYEAVAPLVFINACRSDARLPQYTRLGGWAESFLATGAGAFLGTLWEVRDESANVFAQEFYRTLGSGYSLGEAIQRARTAIRDTPGDPTWLAYALYGDTAATVGPHEGIEMPISADPKRCPS